MKNCVGFDIGNHAVHVAVNKGGKIVRSVSERLPEGLVQSGRITSTEAMIDVLRDLKRSNRLNIRRASLVLPASLCYCRRFNVAAMTKKQLMFNLPYDFHDFITDDKSNYFFDYAIVDYIKDNDGNISEFDVIAAATRKDIVADYTRMFSKAGFKLVTIIPEELAYINLLRRLSPNPHRHGILDIGHNAVRLFLFIGDRFESVRVVDYGCNALDAIIAEHFGVEGKFLPATYRETNFENANELSGCRAIYSAMALEIRKAINFYRFNGGGNLEHLHCCGGGVKNVALMETLRANLPLKLVDLGEFFTESSENVDFPLIAAAVGSTLQ